MDEPGIMDYIHLNGVEWIHYIQMTFKHSSELMLFLTQLGDPRYAFLICFPLAYSLHRHTGIQVLWMSSIAEWLNNVLKWILHGERPYWWIHEVTKHNHVIKVPELEQYRLTCEIGPGSPSGHAMITSAVVYTMITSLIKHKLKYYSVLYSIIVWCLFAVLMLAINVSRLYIATHFPHQVIAGTITGVLISEFIKHEKVTKLRFWHYLFYTFLLILTTVLTYYAIVYIGLDPLWSISKAQEWCANKDWVHLDTSLFFSVVRDLSALMGVGIGLNLASRLSIKECSYSLKVKMLQFITCMTIALFIERYKLPHGSEVIFYTTGFVKYVFVMVLFVVVIPGVFQNILGPNKHDKVDKHS